MHAALKLYKGTPGWKFENRLPGFGSALEKLGYVESFIYLADFFQNFTLLSWMIFSYPSPESPILFTYLIAYFIWKICV